MNTFRFKWSIAGIAFGIFYYCKALIENVDGFESFLPFLQNWDHYELDELLLAIGVIVLFLFVDCLLILRRNRLDHERFLVYRATLDSTHHIVNNFLNQAQILELAAEGHPDFDGEILDMYRATIDEAMAKLEMLDNLEHIEPKHIREVVSPDYMMRMHIQTN